MDFRYLRRRAIVSEALLLLPFATAATVELFNDTTPAPRWVVFNAAFGMWLLINLVCSALSTDLAMLERKVQLDMWLGFVASTVVMIAFMPSLFTSDGWELFTSWLGFAAAAILLAVNSRRIQSRTAAMRAGGQR